MANTRIYYDDAITIKQLQQSTDVGRWIMNVPGNGLKPPYIEDPQIIIQKWGANLSANAIELESDLRGLTREFNNRDCLVKDEYTTTQIKNKPVSYPSSNMQITEESRSVMPAWTARDLEQVNWWTLPHNPQENVCFRFENNISTRILQKDYFIRSSNNYC